MQAASLLVACAAAMPGIAQTEEAHPPLYMDSTQPVEKRVEDLLARMTLEEKIDYIGGNERLLHPGHRTAGSPGHQDVGWPDGQPQ